MTNRKYEEVLPVGYIITEGQRYMLLHPEPLEIRDAWANGLLRFLVVKSGEYLDYVERVDPAQWTYARKVLTVHPQNFSMEIGYNGKPILVWTGEYLVEGHTILLVPEEAEDFERIMGEDGGMEDE